MPCGLRICGINFWDICVLRSPVSRLIAGTPEKKRLTDVLLIRIRDHQGCYREGSVLVLYGSYSISIERILLLYTLNKTNLIEVKRQQNLL